MRKTSKTKSKLSPPEKKFPFGILGVLLLFLILFLPIIPVSYPTEEYITTEVPLKYTVLNAWASSGLKGLNWVTYGHVQLRNDDDQPGTFVVNCYFITLDGTLTDSVRVYIFPGEVKEVTCVGDTKFGQDLRFSYDVQPPTKTISRTVTHTLTKTVSLFQLLIKAI